MVWWRFVGDACFVEAKRHCEEEGRRLGGRRRAFMAAVGRGGIDVRKSLESEDDGLFYRAEDPEFFVRRFWGLALGTP